MTERVRLRQREKEENWSEAFGGMAWRHRVKTESKYRNKRKEGKKPDQYFEEQSDFAVFSILIFYFCLMR